MTKSVFPGPGFEIRISDILLHPLRPDNVIFTIL